MNDKRYITQQNINSERGIKVVKKIEKKSIVDKQDIVLVVYSFMNYIVLTNNSLIIYDGTTTNSYKLLDLNSIYKDKNFLILETKLAVVQTKSIVNDEDIRILNEYINKVRNSTIITSPNIPLSNDDVPTPRNDQNNKPKFYLTWWFITVLFIVGPLTMFISSVLGAVLIYKLDKEKNSTADIVSEYEEKLNNEKSKLDESCKKLNEYMLQFNDEQLNLIKTFNEKNNLEDSIVHLNDILSALKKDIVVLENTVELESFALYVPKYDLPESSQYSDKLNEIREKQKSLIKDKTAAVGDQNFTLNNSQKEGQKMVNDVIKLLLRAFNNECDISISKVKFSNVESYKKRIEKAYETINTLGKYFKINISKTYLNLKLEELYLVYEYEVKKQEEKEEQQLIREQMREEARVQKEIEKEKEKLEKENQHYSNAIATATQQLQNSVTDDERRTLEEKIKELESKLNEVSTKIRDVDYREANTRAGYVYIISNIGSFGENVYKIGMTRRLEPMERVVELGDASVPFTFDVHAMIFSNDAPTLENALHKTFEKQRVNLVNFRKEFFNVDLDDIEQAVKNNFDKSVTFTKTASAEHYRESLKIKEQQTT